ncbi:MAG TPA: fatty acid oxidation complex subunit alpha FadJ [Gemmatimonadales bacterium]|nr:fatty acid oxidation complex subunit alpha FadJ [Gemmatimonadales bacterium]
MSSKERTHALTTVVEDGVAVVTLDLPGEPINMFSRAVRGEFAAALTELEGDTSVRAVVIISGKPEMFVAGADINEFVAAKTEEEATRLSREGQKLLGRVERCRKPVVAAIHGTCLGGGLELVLACHYRVASDHPKTAFGAPEVQLGLLPGAGGCNRLPRALGLRAALQMILTGRSIPAAKAFRMGLVEELVPPAILREVAVAAAQRLAEHPVTQRRGPRGVTAWLLDRSAPGQALILKRARAMTLRQTGGHYPAPLAALDAIRYGLANGMEPGLEHESELFGRMAATDVSRRLVEIFFATTALKKDPGVPAPAPEPRRVERLGIVGAGFMGSGIAAVAATQVGVPVRLKDAELPRIGAGLKAAAGIIGERVRRRSISRRDGARQTALISGTADYSGFRTADLVIEAVFEDLAVKQGVLREIESVARPECIFASNTSTIPISRIAATASRPSNVIGMHFFSPVHRMPLLEVVVGARTAPETVVTAVAFGRRLGKTVIVVQDHPGFFVNRILAPYINEAGHLLIEGVPVDAVDGAMTRWGFPVGPVTLLDEVGLDVAAKAAVVMQEAFGERLKPRLDLAALVADRRLGRKNGRGFFLYRQGKKAGVDRTAIALFGIAPGAMPAPDAVAERLAFAMLNEAVRALEEGVVRSPRDGDIGAIFGIGFPPFRGGPFRALDAMGARAAVETLERLAAAYGDRFRPAAALVERARRGGRFYT